MLDIDIATFSFDISIYQYTIYRVYRYIDTSYLSIYRLSRYRYRRSNIAIWPAPPGIPVLVTLIYHTERKLGCIEYRNRKSWWMYQISKAHRFVFVVACFCFSVSFRTPFDSWISVRTPFDSWIPSTINRIVGVVH